MNFDRLTALLPCRETDDAEAVASPEQAEQMLSAWTALWHPALIDSTGRIPRYAAAATPPDLKEKNLVVLPACAEYLVPTDWFEQIDESESRILRGQKHRPEMVDAALAELKRLDPNRPTVDGELVADFLALGFCHWTIDMLTKRMRYSSNLDEPKFAEVAVSAAKAACRGDAEEARKQLQAAFDLLHTAREYFFPTDAYLLDLMLVAPSTMGASFLKEMHGDHELNLLISGHTLDEMARREPASLDALRRSLTAEKAAILGGEFYELELPLLPPEAIRSQLEKGLACYERHLGIRPTTFGRRRFGMTPVLPQILEQLGFTGVLHATLDDGRFPASDSSRGRWQGIDSTAIEAILRVPASIGQADTFHRLQQNLGNSADMDHAATVIFAHWPGRSSPWFEDLRRVRRYSAVIGSFSTVTNYFERTSYAGQQVSYTADEYRSPYLKQAIEVGRPDPISRWVRYYSQRATAEAAQTLATLAALPSRKAASPAAVLLQTPIEEKGESDPETLLDRVDETLIADASPSPALDRTLEKAVDRSMHDFERSIRGAAAAASGILVANPRSFTSQVCLDVSGLRNLPEVAGPIQAAGESEGKKTVLVDIPPLGFAWIAPGSESAEQHTAKKSAWGLFNRRPAAPPPLAELHSDPAIGGRSGSPRPGAMLRNEFFEIFIDPHTGAIHSIFDYQARGPRLAQQIAMRLGESKEHPDGEYSIMAADEIRVRAAGPVMGEVVARGRLVDRDARRLAGFQQTTRIWRGHRVIEAEIELDVERQPDADPWNSYYAARFAWARDADSIHRSVNQAVLQTDVKQIESPLFVDVRSGKTRTTILAGGLPYHRRLSMRKLDTLLFVRGETSRKFRIGIGIDLPQPMAAALDFLGPACTLPNSPQPIGGSGWLFHLDARGVIANRWQPLMDDGRVIGFRVRLLETEGHSTAMGLRTFRTVASAKKVGYGDRPDIDLPITGDRMAIDLAAHEWAKVEARF